MPVKKKVSKKTKKKKLTRAQGEQCFWVNDGPVVRDLKSLHTALKTKCTDAQFKHHVSSGRSDFAVWVGEVLGDSDCAKVLSRVKTRKTAVSKLEGCLKKY